MKIWIFGVWRSYTIDDIMNDTFGLNFSDSPPNEYFNLLRMQE